MDRKWGGLWLQLSGMNCSPSFQWLFKCEFGRQLKMMFWRSLVGIDGSHGWNIVLWSMRARLDWKKRRGLDKQL